MRCSGGPHSKPHTHALLVTAKYCQGVLSGDAVRGGAVRGGAVRGALSRGVLSRGVLSGGCLLGAACQGGVVRGVTVTLVCRNGSASDRATRTPSCWHILE